MSLHKKIIALVALGMLFFTTIVMLSLSSVMTTFSSISREMEHAAAKTEHIDRITKAVSAMSNDIHHYVASKNTAYRDSFKQEKESILTALDGFERENPGLQDRQMASAMRADLTRLDRRTSRIFALEDPVGKDRNRAYALLVESDSLIEWMGRNMDRHFKQMQTFQSTRMADYVYLQKNRIILLFIMIILSSAGFLIGFSIYVHRKITIPLSALWTGATEISQGNLDYQIRLRGTSDVAQLARRFNDMALKLKSSYAELEKKLLDRTNDLAAIDSVALTLSRASSLKEMLSRSLSKILESMAHLEPRGGVFLCDPDGETMRLVAHEGLPQQFVEREQTIAMGECLCGIAASSGETLYTDKVCDDPRHTRCKDTAPHAHIIIPIKARGIVLGVFFLYPQKAFTLKPSDLRMLDTVGSQLGMAVENLRFYAEVKQSSEKFWDLFENSRDILFTMNTDGTLTSANKAAEKFSSFTKTELIGKSVFDFLTPEGAGAAQRMLRGEGAAGRQPVEFEVHKRDGERAFLEASARSIARNRTVVGYQVSARDITEQKALREKLLTAERLGAIGEIVITVRHEINNPLTTVIGNVELLIERYGDNDKVLAMRLETILNNALRIAEIVKQLQAIKRDKVVEYVKGVSMTDLKQGQDGP